MGLHAGQQDGHASPWQYSFYKLGDRPFFLQIWLIFLKNLPQTTTNCKFCPYTIFRPAVHFSGALWRPDLLPDQDAAPDAGKMNCRAYQLDNNTSDICYEPHGNLSRA
jgi:hypothetical protein